MRNGKRIGGLRWAALFLVAAGVWASPRAWAVADKTYEKLKILVDVLDYVQNNYVEEVDAGKLITGAAEGMVRKLNDPFSQFLEPDMHREIKTETEGQFGGLGIRLGVQGDWPTVITPLPGTPAYRLGILPGDKIVKIEGASTYKMDVVQAAKRLRGTPGTKVAFTVLRDPEEKGKEATTQEFSVTREIIKLESVYSRLLDSQVGYLRITEFSANTPQDVSSALAALKKQGAGALVLDLRNNPGGLLSAAVEVSSYFIGESKLIVYTQGRRPDSREDFRANSRAPYGSLPLVLLVNGGSASGSEIVAGAIQDHHRGVLIGERTFGKASVQSVTPLSDGSGLRLTIAKYYTPSGRSIHRDEQKGTGGILPDIVVPVSRESEIKLQAQLDEIYVPGQKPRSNVKPEDRVKDEILERAQELLKAREVLSALKSQG